MTALYRIGSRTVALHEGVVERVGELETVS